MAPPPAGPCLGNAEGKTGECCRFKIRSDQTDPFPSPSPYPTLFFSLLSFSSKANQGWIKGSSTPVFKHPKTCWMYSIYKAVVDHTASCVQKHPQNPDRWSRIFRAAFDKKPCSGTRRTRSTLPATLPENNKPQSSFLFFSCTQEEAHDNVELLFVVLFDTMKL